MGRATEEEQNERKNSTKCNPYPVQQVLVQLQKHTRCQKDCNNHNS